MLLLLRCALALALMALASFATAGVRTASLVPSSRASSAVARHSILKIVSTGDLQNYLTRVDLGGDPAVGRALLDLMVADIIAYRPDLVIMPGDLTDGPSGGDENCATWSVVDDENHAGTLYDLEWKEIRKYAYDRFIAAGIPVFTVLGNHDSCVDYERTFPGAEWAGYTQYSAEYDAIPSRCGGAAIVSCGTPNTYSGSATGSDTSHRKALYPSAVGTFCVIGIPESYGSGPDLDQAWIRARIGCGAGRPTILVSHNGGDLAILSGGLNATQKGDVIANIRGHFIPTVGCEVDANCPVLFQVNGTAGATGVLDSDISFNTQELTGGPAGFTNHTGFAWWMSWGVDPVANTSTVTGHNPWLGGATTPPAGGGYAVNNSTLTLPYNWCTEFGGPQC
jgi:hypothetical protein